MARRTKKHHPERTSNLKRAVYLILLSIGLLFFFMYVGLPLIARLSTFVADLRKQDEAVVIDDSTPPAPPTIELPPEYTKDSVVKIVGRAEEGASVIIFHNLDETEILADKDGDFVFNFELNKGKNFLSLKAIDNAGNESKETREYEITNDNDSPVVTITQPADGDSFFGPQERQLTIEGEVDEDAEITINGRFVVLGSDGTFTFAATLGDGDNNFNIKAKDGAGNDTEMDIKVSYSS